MHIQCGKGADPVNSIDWIIQKVQALLTKERPISIQWSREWNCGGSKSQLADIVVCHKSVFRVLVVALWLLQCFYCSHNYSFTMCSFGVHFCFFCLGVPVLLPNKF